MKKLYSLCDFESPVKSQMVNDVVFKSIDEAVDYADRIYGKKGPHKIFKMTLEFMGHYEAQTTVVRTDVYEKEHL